MASSPHQPMLLKPPETSCLAAIVLLPAFAVACSVESDASAAIKKAMESLSTSSKVKTQP